MSDEITFAAEETQPQKTESGVRSGAWKILVVDDQEDIHNITRLVLGGLTFEGRDVVCLSAYSGAEAKEMLSVEPDIAVMLLDVVMESTHAGLDVARFVRDEIHNNLVRIILRTGQPGEAPEHHVVTELDINDYRSKTELTAERLVTSVITAIRSYRDIKSVSDSRRGLHHLATSVAHQVRNRTTAIGGFANLIKRKAGLPEDMAEHLGAILEESARLESMVGDVTRYASISLGDLKTASIRDLLEQAMDRVDARETADSEVVWSIFSPDQTVLVDIGLFVDAFEAIMCNCVDFSGDAPEVSIKVNPDRLTCIVEVSDCGCGIAEDDLPHIFDPFFTRKADGSGMGLALVRRIAMEHQWDMTVDSIVGQGTTVRVIMPRKELTGVTGR